MCIRDRFGSNLKVDNFIDEGVPVIKGTNLHEGGFAKANFSYVSEEKASSLKRCLAYPDDLVFTHRGTLGQVGIIPQNLFPKYLVSQSQMRLTVDKNYLLPKYLYYFFKSNLGQKELLKNSSQVGVPAIANPTKSLKQVEITVPDLPTQTQIAQILTSLDDKIELNLQMNQTLEAMAQALFKEWFVNFNFPSSELGLEGLNDDRIFHKKGKKENKEILPTSNQQNHNSDNLPKGWRMGKLGDISTNFDNKRVPLSSMQRKDRQGIYPYYGAATIFDYIDDYIFDGTFLLMGEDGTVQTDEGFPLLQYVWGKFWVNNHTHVLQGKIPFSTEYLYLLLSKTNITHLITCLLYTSRCV